MNDETFARLLSSEFVNAAQPSSILVIMTTNANTSSLFELNNAYYAIYAEFALEKGLGHGCLLLSWLGFGCFLGHYYEC